MSCLSPARVHLQKLNLHTETISVSVRQLLAHKFKCASFQVALGWHCLLAHLPAVMSFKKMPRSLILCFRDLGNHSSIHLPIICILMAVAALNLHCSAIHCDENWLRCWQLPLWMYHRICTKVTLPIGCSQPMTEHDAGTNVVLLLCSTRLFQWATGLEDSPLPWLNLSWNHTAVWDHYCPTFLPSASKGSDLCFPPNTLSAYSCPIPLYSSQLSSSLAHLTPCWHLLLGGPKLIMSIIFILPHMAKSR